MPSPFMGAPDMTWQQGLMGARQTPGGLMGNP